MKEECCSVLRTVPRLLDSMIYWITSGVLNYAKRNTEQTIHTGIQEDDDRNDAGRKAKLSRTARCFEVTCGKRMKEGRRIYLTEDTEGFT